MQEHPEQKSTAITDSEEAYELSAALVEEIIDAFEDGTQDTVKDKILNMHAADMGELFNIIPSEYRQELTDLVSTSFDPEMLTYINTDIREEVIEWLGLEKSADAIAQLETDDAIHVIEDLGAEEQQEILEAIPEEARSEIEEALAYPENSAGRLMRTSLVMVPEYWSVGNTIDFLRKDENLPDDFYTIFVVDPKFHPIGGINLSRAIRSSREVSIKEIMSEDLKVIRTDMDQEEVAHIFRKYGLAEAPVINQAGRLMGVITVDDVVDVIQEESEEDLMRLGGVSHQDLHAGLLETFKSRIPWLLVNLLTASIASRVIGGFENIIEQLVTLAVLMPIIASIGGNAGTQVVTVTVRALAARELKLSNSFNLIRKEAGVAILNGLCLALLSSSIVFLIFQNLLLASVFGGAILINLMIAGMSGALIPIFFSRTRIDPAVASSVFLTMLTDVCGFFVFLGLAALVLT